MTQWERAVEAAAKAIHQAKFCNEAPNAIGEVEARWLRKEAAAALRAALPALFEARQWEGWDSVADALAINEYRIWLDAHRLALEAEASHE